MQFVIFQKSRLHMFYLFSSSAVVLIVLFLLNNKLCSILFFFIIFKTLFGSIFLAFSINFLSTFTNIIDLGDTDLFIKLSLSALLYILSISYSFCIISSSFISFSKSTIIIVLFFLKFFIITFSIFFFYIFHALLSSWDSFLLLHQNYSPIPFSLARDTRT